MKRQIPVSRKTYDRLRQDNVALSFDLIGYRKLTKELESELSDIFPRFPAPELASKVISSIEYDRKTVSLERRTHNLQLMGHGFGRHGRRLYIEKAAKQLGRMAEDFLRKDLEQSL